MFLLSFRMLLDWSRSERRANFFFRQQAKAFHSCVALCLSDATTIGRVPAPRAAAALPLPVRPGGQSLCLRISAAVRGASLPTTSCRVDLRTACVFVVATRLCKARAGGERNAAGAGGRARGLVSWRRCQVDAVDDGDGDRSPRRCCPTGLWTGKRGLT